MSALVKAVVMFSGGIGSWGAAMRAVDRFGAENVILLFTDTRMEDADLYRFLRESAALTGARLVEIADGRTPWQVFRDRRFLANRIVDHCSRILKRELADAWVAENAPGSVRVLGLDWMEQHRVDRSVAFFARVGVTAWCPLTEKPWVSKAQLIDQVRALGVEPPRLYAMGFPHNNCGGFCVKAGQAQFAHLLRMIPERYAEHEREEESMRELLGDVSVMRDRRGGESKPLSMRAFRERIEADQSHDEFEWGGCNCFDVSNDASPSASPVRLDDAGETR